MNSRTEKQQYYLGDNFKFEPLCSRRNCPIQVPKNRNCSLFLFLKTLCIFRQFTRIWSRNFHIFFIFSRFTQLILSLILITLNISIKYSLTGLAINVVNFWISHSHTRFPKAKGNSSGSSLDYLDLVNVYFKVFSFFPKHEIPNHKCSLKDTQYPVCLPYPSINMTSPL